MDKPKTILLIEDGPYIGAMQKQILEDNGHEVIHVMTGRYAMKAVEERPPDLIILDLMLPDMDDDLDLLRALKGKTNVPIVVCTALTGNEIREGAYQLGVEDFILKPFEINEFVDRVEAALNQAPKPPD